MMDSFFKNIVLVYPVKVLLFTLLIVSFFGYGATKLEIDASSETILLENDSDLLFAREVSKKFETQNMLVIAFKPNEPMLSENNQNIINKMSNELLKLKQIDSINSILNVPLFQSTDKTLKELIANMPTLSNTKPDLKKVKNEFLTSPLYKNSLVSQDFKTTAIVLNLKDDEILSTNKEKAKIQRDRLRVENHQFIENIRTVLKKYENSGKLFLGGVNMISDDLIGFVKNDLFVFGSALLLILILVLWATFRELRWVVLPVVISASSIVSTSGLLGFFGWEVTVISSNFVSLQLIITLAIVLHLIVRYRELVHLHPNFSQKELVFKTIISKLSPTFFAILTTIVGFASLMFSDILPIINLGWMMSGGIAISLVLAFIIFPALLVMLPITKLDIKNKKKFAPTKIMSNWVENYGKVILVVSTGIIIFSLSGSAKLIVENSFINYFRPSTEIYKGMEIIDAQLGGTTPLDIVVKFIDKKEKKVISSEDDFEDDFEAEFEEEENSSQYWFTPEKMQFIMKIHDYLENKKEIGSVQSFGTTLKLGRILNDGKDLDSFALALLYNKLPEEFRKIIISPYIHVDNNEIRFSTRIIDSNKELRRDDFIKEIQQDLEKMIDPKIATFRQSNLMVLYNNMLQSLFSSQIVTLGFVVILLFIMFLLIFKNLPIALIAITANVVSISVIFGFMGWLNIPLDLMTITIAAISLGIGVDDTIHYIHRFYEELEEDGDYIKAMHRSHNSVGYAMYYTSFAIMLGFSILVLSNFMPTIYFGFLTMLAMLMALLGALLLLPKLIIMFKPKLN